MTIPAALIVLSALGPLDDKPAPKDGDLAKLQGTWIGKAGPQGDRMDVEIEFKGSTMVMHLSRNGQTRTGRGDFKIDESAKPKALDLVDFRVPEDSPPLPAPPFIYALEGDTLKLCGAGDPDQPRPTEFKAIGSGRTMTMLMELTRKPAPK